MESSFDRRAALISDLEILGESEVRMRLASGRIYGADKEPIVQEWLRSKERARNDADNAAQLRIANSAKNAAWAAAIAAIIAAIFASATVVINPPWASSSAPSASSSEP